jgi:hypothetical protein
MGDSSRLIGHGPRQLVEAVLDIESTDGWVRVTALLGDPEPEVGQVRPTLHSITAARDTGEIVALRTEEIHALGERFERAYNRWRGSSGAQQSR